MAGRYPASPAQEGGRGMIRPHVRAEIDAMRAATARLRAALSSGFPREYIHRGTIICTLIEALAAHTGRANSTVSRLSTGSGDTYRRLTLTGTDGVRKHRITTARAEAAINWFAANWPKDLEWPAGVPRPPITEEERP